MISSLFTARGGASCVGVLAILLMVAARVEGQVSKPSKETPTNDFSIVVKVADAVSGKPLENSTVTVPQLMPRPGGITTNQWRFVTAANGATTVNVPAGIVGFNYFSLGVSNANYPYKEVSWNAQSGTVRGSLPAEYTFRLEQGGAIGGYVHDERGKPLAGVKVVPWGSGAAAYRYDQLSSREYSVLGRDDTLAATTDAQGFWRYTNFPADIVSYTVDMLRSDGSRSVFITSGSTRQFATEAGEEIDAETLRTAKAVLTLKDGVNIRGVVVNEAGQAVAGVLVKERSGVWWNTPIQQVTNDAQGKFVFPRRTGAQYLLTAEANGYAISSEIVTVTPDMAEVKLTLAAARPLRLRILGENDEPIPGADISLPDHRNRGHLLTWKGSTDGDGRVLWATAPRQALSLAVSATNHAMRLARVESSGQEQTVRLRKEATKTIAVQVRALDGQTQKPIPKFTVWRDLEPNNDFKGSDWVGTNGELKTQLAAQDFREGRAYAYRFQIRAEGYAPWSSEMLYFDEGDSETTVTLKPAKRPVGIVLLPDGQPAADAKVMLAGGQGSIFMNSPDRQYPGTGVITLQSGADGSFQFDGAEDEQRIVVLHRDGFASVTVEELRRTGRIALQAWARIDGVLRGAGKPLAKERISIKSPVSWAALDSHHLVFSATTDAEGTFVFTNLPPGDYVLYRTPNIIMGMSTTESHRMILDLAAGESRKLDYGFAGRMVVGRVDAGAEVDWKNDPHLLTVRLPPAPPTPNYYAYADAKDFEKARRMHGRSKAVLDYERKRQQFQLVFDREGNFKADDVPPGKYELTIRVTKPNKDSRRGRFEGREEVLGTVKREITVPAGAAGEEFDLGSMEMEVKESLAARSAPLDFTLEQLDGKPVALMGLRGRPTLLVFWAKWAPRSAAKLDELRTAVASLEANRRPALLTVNLDSNADDARDGVKGLGHGWIHTWLTGTSLFEVTEQLNVDTLPTVLLLDAQGRTMGRDMDGKRLVSMVRRLVASKN